MEHRRDSTGRFRKSPSAGSPNEFGFGQEADTLLLRADRLRGKADPKGPAVEPIEPDEAPGHEAARSETGPEAARETEERLVLALTELKVYLSEFDSRMSRLENRLGDITQTVHTAADLLQRGQNTGAAEDQTTQGHAGALSSPVQMPSSLLSHSGWDSSEIKEWEPALQEQSYPLPGSATERLAALRSILHREDALVDPARTLSGRERLRAFLNLAAVSLTMVGVVGLVLSLLVPQGKQGGVSAQAGAKQVSPAGRGALQPATLGNPADLKSATPYKAADVHPGARAGDMLTREPGTTTPTLAKKKADPVGTVALRPQEQAVEPVQLVLDAAPTKTLQNARSTASDRVGDSGATPATTAVRTQNAEPTGVEIAGAGKGLLPAASAEVSSASISPTPVRSGRAFLVPASTMQGRLVSAREPVFPPEALREHMEGRVVLNALIAKDGTVQRMDVVEGPYVFVKSALAAVSWRRYRPYLVDGKPVEVETQITLNYAGR